MADCDDFMRAILREPDDDSHRLIYADYLDENGEPERAEFIRVQCQLSTWTCDFKQTKEQPGWKHDCGTNDAGYWLCQPLRSRERELLRQHAAQWSGLPGTVWVVNTQSLLWSPSNDGVSYPFEFRRGFVEEVTLTAADWLRYHEKLSWYPQQRMDCPECVADPPTGWYYKADTCPECAGKRTVPRPFVPNAQPIRRVTLSTEPNWDDWKGNVLVTSPTLMGFIDDRWPGITFTIRSA